ncbi:MULTISPECIES: non-homologous end-joining DNA ligase [Brevibacillus]|uniref:non-homologous end-joining DNA ligase n=1 Tax=Brevibacillus TaxID=55080 RepID=UPI00156BBFB8|nr:MULTISPECIES: non-homologous end-joining DNA ligase [Brevibacillus]NRQ53567.1 DNA polymerase domain-containing protein [Brevibacillus sp. HD1.4A]MBU8711488.1 non-homologous end-joining DNA ligase [Brevibacillus parabrevis]MDH6349883.1 bifunctional non-homologous end joining protein LigD [Brevibacillus sp. 1238]MDR4999337.1 non-homologous end-joining DNA ligase [Brevibacillus parabrevis]MED2254102.1 non-homologous end-joining DNA ligase [Brevibacillus parabrevis]
MAYATKEYELTIAERTISISNPEKPLWPEANVTKLDYLRYLLTVAPYMLRYAHDRLLTVIRYPHGIHDKHFYQKNIPDYAPDWIKTHTWENVRYVLCNDEATLLWMANQAALEWHVSFHLAADETPTELVFDLDPSTDDFSVVIESALLLKELLDELKLPAYVKTSGASGLQVYVPIERRYAFEQTRQVGHFIASYLVSKHPAFLTIERMVKNRGTKLYIDYLQHWRGKTLPAPYSTRAKKLATVSAPLRWEELPQAHPSAYTVHTVPERLRELGDLFSAVSQPDKPASLDPILDFLHAR